MIKEFLMENSGVKYVDKDIFYTCYHKIQQWLDVSILVGYLMKYKIVQNSDELETLTSPHRDPQYKKISLIKYVERAGKDGFMLFYMCLKESSDKARGHGDAVAELDNCGK